VSEATLIECIAAMAAVRPGVRIGIGDDAAVLDGDPAIVLAHDMLVEDVHFRWRTASPRDVGHKALAVNLSDMAAMGAAPVAVLVGLGLPRGGEATDRVAGIYAGMEALAAEWGCTIAGGDVTAAAETVLGVTVVGRMSAGVAPALRSGARPGDVLWVTGPLGASVAGLHLLEDPALPRPPAADDLCAAHLRPRPRIREGAALAAAGVHAMLDCSDGLAIDARRLALASGARVVLELERVPVADGVAAVARALDEPPDAFAATGGEDYELIVAAPPGLRVAGCTLHPVGRVEAGPAELRIERDGDPVALGRLGWDHDVG